MLSPTSSLAPPTAIGTHKSAAHSHNERVWREFHQPRSPGKFGHNEHPAETKAHLQTARALGKVADGLARTLPSVSDGGKLRRHFHARLHQKTQVLDLILKGSDDEVQNMLRAQHSAQAQAQAQKHEL